MAGEGQNLSLHKRGRNLLRESFVCLVREAEGTDKLRETESSEQGWCRVIPAVTSVIFRGELRHIGLL